MQFKSLFFAACAAIAVSATQSQQQPLKDESCAAGAIIGKFAVCGTNATDCGLSPSGQKCCLAGQKCGVVSGDYACLDTVLVPSATVTVNAGCYGTKTGTASSLPTVSDDSIVKATSSVGAIPTVSGSAKGATGAGSTGVPKTATTTTSGHVYPFTNSAAASGGSSTRGPVLATGNAAPIQHSSNSNFAVLLSGMGLMAYLL